MLTAVRVGFTDRHRDVDDTWAQHFALLEHRIEGVGHLTHNRRQLIRAYFTQEFAIEGAALLNPSMVPHPDQGGLRDGSTRFVMTLRAIGEGHISSIELREGIVDDDGIVTLSPPADVTVLPDARPTTYSRTSFEQQLADLGGDRTNSDFVLSALPDHFGRHDLDRALDELRGQSLTRGAAVRTIDRFEWIAASSYRVEFPEHSSMQERVLMPTGPAESHGMEDVRMLRFTDLDDSTRYLGTYTAYDGRSIASQLIQTDDFRTFDVTQLNGPGSRNKGMALFPRPIAGRFVALSRADRESNGITTSDDLRRWEAPVLVQTPTQPWELVQLGNCGPAARDARGVAGADPRRRSHAAVRHRRPAPRSRGPHDRARHARGSAAHPHRGRARRLRPECRLLLRRHDPWSLARPSVRLQRRVRPHRAGRDRSPAHRPHRLARTSGDCMTVPTAPYADILTPPIQTKPWGHEVLFAARENEYVGKLIFVKAGQALSLQYHDEKDETITILSGEGRLEHGPSADDLRTRVMRPGHTVHLPAKVVHRITAVTDIQIVEVSTAAPGWRDDVVRLSDRYGRAGTNAP